MGVLLIRALLLGVQIRAPDFLNSQIEPVVGVAESHLK